MLSKMLEPPERTSVEGAVERLQGVGALDSRCELTPLGFHLALLPVDVRIGKLMLFGAVFRCLDSALTIAASLSYRSPFLSPFGKREEADRRKRTFAARNSDHLAALRAYQSWHDAVKKSHFAGYNYAQENYLSHKTMLTLAQTKHQFLELLSNISFAPSGITMRWLSRKARNGGDAVLQVTGEEMNAHGSNHRLLVSVLCAALYPNIVQILSPELRYKETASGAVARAPDAQEYKFKTKADGYVHIHPSSVCHSAGGFESPYLVFNEKIKTSRVFIREMSMVPIYPMILFGGTGAGDLYRSDKIVSAHF